MRASLWIAIALVACAEPPDPPPRSSGSVAAPSGEGRPAREESRADDVTPERATEEAALEPTPAPVADEAAPSACPPAEHPEVESVMRGHVELVDVAVANESGERDRAALEQLAGRTRSAFVACQERELRCHPRLAGSVELSFSLDAGGRLRDIAYASIGPPAIEIVAACIATRVRPLIVPGERAAPVDARIELALSPADATETCAPAAGGGGGPPVERAVPGRVRLPDAAAIEQRGEGDLDPEIVRRVLGTHEPALRACYERARACDPALAGHATAAFTIAADGHVRRVAAWAGEDLASSYVPECIRRAIAAFPPFDPPPRGGPLQSRFELILEPRT